MLERQRRNNMFDSLLFGNGLNIDLFDKCKKISSNKSVKYVNSSIFIEDLVSDKEFSDFSKYFIKDKGVEENIQLLKKFTLNNIKDINLLGFERWFSRNLFSKDMHFEKIKIYLYFMYNYWYETIHQIIISDKKCVAVINDISKSILDVLNKDALIFTTNFDNYFDGYLKPDHLHGSFATQLTCFEDIILAILDNKYFEYKYLFGTSGLEKLSRISSIHNIKQKTYNLNLFYNRKLKLGNLLICGLAFGKAEMLSESFLKKYPDHDKNIIYNNVDGHILFQLEIRQREENLDSITITYFNDADLANYRKLFSLTTLSNITTYMSIGELFN